MATANFENTRTEAIEASNLNPFAIIWFLQVGPDAFKFQYYKPIKGEQHRVIGIFRNGESINWTQAE
jgi:hypothetical protein